MKKQISILGSLLAAGALAIAGCGGGGGGGGTGGKADGGGTGGKADGGGTGGKGMGGATSTGGSTGTGGKLDAGGTGGVATTTDAGDARTDSGSGGTGTGGTTGAGGGAGGSDAGGDAGPCTTSFPNGTLEFAFDQGANLGWSGLTGGDVSTTTASLGGSNTEGSKCPGAVSLFVTYGSHVGQTVALAYNHNSPPLNWGGFSKAHFWVKLVASDYSGINGIQPYVQSHSDYSNYKSHFVATSEVSNGGWHEEVVDITASDLANVVQLGVQIQFAPASDAGANGGSATLYVDDIWIENAPPTPDAGPETGPDTAADATTTTDAGADAGADVPIDAAVDGSIDTASN